jgi:two-component system CitB family sensor kinase
VVGNLIDNALDAVPGGLGDPWVEVTLATEGRTLVVEVADSGPGVPARMRDRVFDDGFTTKATDGPGPRGVGLALARRIAERRGGSLQVSDAPGGGALFTARLPGAVLALEEAAP